MTQTTENSRISQGLPWRKTEDGFELCTAALSDILLQMGIYDTGISGKNPRDVESYYDDWYLFRIRGEAGLLKLREQEHDYVPGFSDKDVPGVTVSFISFQEETLWALEENPSAQALAEFVAAFRAVTDLPGQHHSPVLQAYFSDPGARGPYLIARAYVEKLLSGLVPVPFPDDWDSYPRRLKVGLHALDALSGGKILDEANRCIRIGDKSAPTRLEQDLLLAAHCGNLNAFSFAAEIKFHADALISPLCRLPGFGKRWYHSAIRADLTAKEDGLPIQSLLAPYYRERGKLMREQRRLHGEKEV